jgi:hypothetical protein
MAYKKPLAYLGAFLGNSVWLYVQNGGWSTPIGHSIAPTKTPVFSPSTDLLVQPKTVTSCIDIAPLARPLDTGWFSSLIYPVLQMSCAKTLSALTKPISRNGGFLWYLTNAVTLITSSVFSSCLSSWISSSLDPYIVGFPYIKAPTSSLLDSLATWIRQLVWSSISSLLLFLSWVILLSLIGYNYITPYMTKSAPPSKVSLANSVFIINTNGIDSELTTEQKNQLKEAIEISRIKFQSDNIRRLSSPPPASLHTFCLC